MILKTEYVPGLNVAALVAYVHSEENRVWPDAPGNTETVVGIKLIEAQKPDGDWGDPTLYRVTLDIRERRDPGGNRSPERIDPKYLLRVYSILSELPSDAPVQSGMKLSEALEALVDKFDPFLMKSHPFDIIHESTGEIILRADRKLTRTLTRKLLANLHQLELDSLPNCQLTELIKQLRNEIK